MKIVLDGKCQLILTNNKIFIYEELVDLNNKLILRSHYFTKENLFKFDENTCYLMKYFFEFIRETLDNYKTLNGSYYILDI